MVEEFEPSSGTAPPSRSILGRWLLVVVLVILVGGFYALGGQHYFSWEAIRSNAGGWKDQVEANLLLAVVVYFLVYVAVTALSLPIAVVLTLVGGMLFGRWLGTGVISVAATLGATLAFLLSRYLLRDWVQSRFGPRLKGLERGIERDGAYYLFTLRLIPAVPFWLINLGMGLTPMRVGVFALVSWLGMLPGTFVYVNLGSAAQDTLEAGTGQVPIDVLVALALLGLVPLAIRKTLQWWARWRGA